MPLRAAARRRMTPVPSAGRWVPMGLRFRPRIGPYSLVGRLLGTRLGVRQRQRRRPSSRWAARRAPHPPTPNRSLPEGGMCVPSQAARPLHGVRAWARRASSTAAGFAATFPAASRARKVARARMGAGAPRTAAGFAATFPAASRARKVARARMGAGAPRTAVGFAATFPTAARKRKMARARMGAIGAQRTGLAASTRATAARSPSFAAVPPRQCAHATAAG